MGPTDLFCSRLGVRARLGRSERSVRGAGSGDPQEEERLRLDGRSGSSILICVCFKGYPDGVVFDLFACFLF